METMRRPRQVSVEGSSELPRQRDNRRRRNSRERDRRGDSRVRQAYYEREHSRSGYYHKETNWDRRRRRGSWGQSPPRRRNRGRSDSSRPQRQPSRAYYNEQRRGRSRSRSERRSGRSHDDGWRPGGSAGSMADDEGHYRGGPGRVLAHRYEVERDVGIGTFGRVLQCFDRMLRRSVAVKVVRNVEKYYESALIEADILRDVGRRPGSAGLCVQLLDQFNLHGHCCLVFERLGQSLYDYLKANGYRGFPLPLVRDVSRQLLETLRFLHGMGLVHTDLKPENVLFCDVEDVEWTPPGGSSSSGRFSLPRSSRIKVIDFGGATYVDDHKSAIVNTRQYRAPEVILGLGWCTPSDMWSLGCIIAEAYQGDLLFETHDNMEHLALIERCVGPFPPRMLEKSRVTNKYFDQSGWARGGKHGRRESLERVRRMPAIQDVVRPSDVGSGLSLLLEDLLRIDPDKRTTAQEALQLRFVSPREGFWRADARNDQAAEAGREAAAAAAAAAANAAAAPVNVSSGSRGGWRWRN